MYVRVYVVRQEVERIYLDVHPHEASKEYNMRVQSRREGPKDNKWEDCRVLSKFKTVTSRGAVNFFCNVECKLRKDLGETMPFRPEHDVK